MLDQRVYCPKCKENVSPEKYSRFIGACYSCLLKVAIRKKEGTC